METDPREFLQDSSDRDKSPPPRRAQVDLNQIVCGGGGRESDLELCRSSDDSDLFYGNLFYGTPAVAERVQKLEEVLNNKREELELSLLEETVAALRDEVVSRRL